MYELRLTRQQKDRFVNVARNRLVQRKMTLKDLAEQIERPVNSVYGFFNSSKSHQKPNKFLAAEIANALEMESRDWSV